MDTDDKIPSLSYPIVTVWRDNYRWVVKNHMEYISPYLPNRVICAQETCERTLVTSAVKYPADVTASRN